MSWFALITNLISILTILLRARERDRIVSEVELIERARIIQQINQSLAVASQIPVEIAKLTDKELDEHVRKKGWYRD